MVLPVGQKACNPPADRVWYIVSWQSRTDDIEGEDEDHNEYFDLDKWTLSSSDEGCFMALYGIFCLMALTYTI